MNMSSTELYKFKTGAVLGPIIAWLLVQHEHHTGTSSRLWFWGQCPGDVGQGAQPVPVLSRAGWDCSKHYNATAQNVFLLLIWQSNAYCDLHKTHAKLSCVTRSALTGDGMGGREWGWGQKARKREKKCRLKEQNPAQERFRQPERRKDNC